MWKAFSIILSCLVIQGLSAAEQPSPWKPIGKTINFTERTMSHVLSPGGKLAAWTSAKDDGDCNQDIVLHDVSTGHDRRIKPFLARSDDWQDVQSLRFSADSTKLAVAILLPERLSGRVDVYDVSTGRRLRTVRYKKRSEILHTSTITVFQGNHLEISDEFEGTYVLTSWKVRRFIRDQYRDSVADPRVRRGSWMAWSYAECPGTVVSDP